MPEMKFKTKWFQWDFFKATNRFPSMVAGWGTGKTAFALFKGISLSESYKDNLGVIVRSKFTDLRDSTMKDYTTYTKKSVPQGTKESAFPNGSKVLFRHAKDLSGLQNVNIGWFYIEQAEEFPTEKQFMLLRGRLRRVLTPNDDVQERLCDTISDVTGLPALKEVVDDWRALKSDAVGKDGERIVDPQSKTGKFFNERDIAEMALVDQLGIALRQGMVIANSNGHNWVWKKFVKSNLPEHSCIEACSWENEDNVPRDTIADWRRLEVEAPATYKQYVMNCHDEVDIDACYYISIMNEMRSNGHLAKVNYDPSVRVHLSFDIGLDCTAIWFLQIVNGKRLLIDYYENTGKFLDHYAKILDSKKYNYGKVILPHDGTARSKISGENYAKALTDLGYKVHVNPRIAEKDIGIQITAGMLPSFYMDEDKCKSGIEALDHYRREYDEDNRVYREKPLHDWASHPCDSLKEMCQALKAGLLGSSSGASIEQVKKWSKFYSRTG
jgi:hypothetical protein